LLNVGALPEIYHNFWVFFQHYACIETELGAN
jgi:hypothetical protein